LRKHLAATPLDQIHQEVTADVRRAAHLIGVCPPQPAPLFQRPIGERRGGHLAARSIASRERITTAWKGKQSDNDHPVLLE
jgi:hypothetical protein